MEVVGHIKIGNTTRGLPAMLGKIHLTTTAKNGMENFSPYEDTKEEGYKSISVGVPFIHNVQNNFKVGEISFVLVNDIYKYRAEVKNENEHVILTPYQPYFENPILELPVIKLGLATKWRDNLDMKTRAIAYFLINGKLFDFKTSSAFSIQEMKRAFNILSKFKAKDIARVNLDLMLKTKLFKTKKTEEVTYLTLSEITFDSFLKNNTEISDSLIDSLCEIEEEDLRFNTNKPVTLKAAENFFGKKITVKLDNEENNQFLEISDINGSDKNIVEKIEKIEKKKQTLQEKKDMQIKKIDNNKDIFDKLIEVGLPNPIVIALINIFEDKAYIEAEKLEFFMPNILKLISNHKS